MMICNALTLIRAFWAEASELGLCHRMEAWPHGYRYRMLATPTWMSNET